MKHGRKNTILKKSICGIVAAALAATSVSYVWNREELVAQASTDTLPGLKEIRDEVLEGDEAFRILELVPEIAEDGTSAAQGGYLIGGSEPLKCLYDTETGTYLSWTEKLGRLSTREERVRFMNETLRAEVAEVNSGFAIAPMTYTTYEELDAEEDGCSKLETGSEELRGYFVTAAGESAQWNVTYQRISEDISGDTINYGTNTPYYAATPSSTFAGAAADGSLTYAQLLTLDRAGTYAGLALYTKGDDGYYTYQDTLGNLAPSLWEQFTVNDSGEIVAGKDISPGNAYTKGTGDATTYYVVDFQLLGVFDTYSVNNPWASGTPVYTVSAAEYVGTNGSYSLQQTQKEFGPGAEYTTQSNTIYYKGGLTNSDRFLKTVMGLDDAELADFDIEVTVVTPSGLNSRAAGDAGQAWLDTIDMVHIAGGSYVAADDLDATALCRLAYLIGVGEVPCIVDADSFVSRADGSYQTPADTSLNIAKLVYYLMLGEAQQSSYVTSTGISDSLSGLDYDASGLKEQLNMLDSDLDGNFLNASVWFRSGSLSNLSDTTYSDAAATAESGDFYAVYAELLQENFYREAESTAEGTTAYEPLDTTVNDAAVWRYIINYARQRVVAEKTSLSVLDIEPATNVASVSSDKISAWTGVDTSGITITAMSITEFIGKIEEINSEYDMIYIGSSIDNLRHANNDSTVVYNDTSMKGLLYTHTGDTYTGKDAIGGLRESDYAVNEDGEIKLQSTTYRLSGNDLTADKYNELLGFLRASYPIVVSSDLLTVSGSSYTINEDKIDNSSYLYDLLNYAIEQKMENLFSAAEMSVDSNASKNAEFLSYINMPKLKLIEGYTWTDPEDSSNTEATFLVTSEAKYKDNDNVTQISKSNDGYYYLELQFTIENEGAVYYDQKYQCNLYLDANADGKFSEETEQMSGVSVTDSDGNGVDASELVAGELYTVRRRIPNGYYGCITWNLEVAHQDNAYVKVDRTGYTKLIRDADDHVETIKILQIYAGWPNLVINLEQSIGDLVYDEYGNATGYENVTAGSSKTISYFNTNDNKVETKTSYATSYFHDLAENVKDDYLLDITTIDRGTFNTGVYQYGNRKGEKINLSEYDMLILGFGDGQSGEWNDEMLSGAENSIKSFIASGKCVLFAHDMTSKYNAEEKYYYGSATGSDPDRKIYSKQGGSFRYSGYDLNRNLRDVLGLDTYGIMTNEGLRSSASDGGLILSGEEYNAYSTNDYVDSNGDTVVTMPAKNADGTYTIGFGDIAFTPKSGRTSTVAQTQGYSVYPFVSAAASDVYGYRYALQGNKGNLYSTKAKQENKGQITNYPYLIDETIDIKTTHQQAYALDMNSDDDQDGQTDTVVWYTLSGDSFSVMPGDVLNNYYIYTKGNVTYTGMGHYADDRGGGQYEHQTNAVTETEAKLFINTMVAAYNAAQKTPEIETSANGTVTDTIYGYYDELINDDSEIVSIDFTVSDRNISLANKTVEVRCYVENEESGTTATLSQSTGDNALVDVTELLTDVTDTLASSSGDIGVYDVNGTRITDLSNLQVDTTYTLRVPLSYFRMSNNGYATDVYLAACVTIQDTTMQSQTTEWSIKSVSYVNVELFDLD